jgi:homoserine dehydrogenase
VRPLRDMVGFTSSDPIIRVEGVLNGTSEFIARKIQEQRIINPDVHVNMMTILEMAETAGLMERGTTDDLDGSDSSRKIRIVAAIMGIKDLQVTISPSVLALQRAIESGTVTNSVIVGSQIVRLVINEEGKASLASVDIKKQIVAERPEMIPEMIPEIIPANSLEVTQLCSINATKQTAKQKCNHVMSFGGHGAGGRVTALAMMSDVSQTDASLYQQLFSW